MDNITQLKEYVLSLMDSSETKEEHLVILDELITLIELGDPLYIIKDKLESYKNVTTQMLSVVAWLEQPQLTFVEALIKSSGVDV